MADRHNNNNKINKISDHLVGNNQTALEHNYSSNINHFYGRERTEQKLTNINMYGLVRMLEKSTKVRSAGAKNVPS